MDANMKTEAPKKTIPTAKPDEYKVVKVALLGAFAKLLETGNEFAQIAKTQFEFKNGTAMRAVACDLFRKSAVQTGTAEAVQECADKLLSIAEAQDEREDKKRAFSHTVTTTVEDDEGGNGTPKKKQPVMNGRLHVRDSAEEFIRKGGAGPAAKE